MRNLILACAVTVLTLPMTACSTVQPGKDAMLAGYTNVFVKPLSFSEVVLQKVAGSDQEKFNDAKPALARSFNESFSRAQPKTKHPLKVVFGGTPGADTVVLEPKLSLIDPGIKNVLRGRGVATCRLTDSSSGKLLGSYTVSREVNRPEWGTSSEAIEELVRGLGAEAARHMPEAR